MSAVGLVAKATGNTPYYGALLISAAAAMGDGVRPQWARDIADGSLGRDTLHHFFANAVNGYAGGYVVGTAMAYTRNIFIDNARSPEEARDRAANIAGANFGARLERGTSGGFGFRIPNQSIGVVYPSDVIRKR
jgi:hypothetical protein